LQRAGGKRLSSSAFLAGHPIALGTRFGAGWIVPARHDL